MANDINKIFVNVSYARSSEFISTYSTTYQGTGTPPEKRDETRDNQVAFLTSYGTIVTHGEVLTGGLKAEVTVEGGPLADDSADNWPEAWKKDGNRIIPANTDLQTLIEKLFLQEINGNLNDPTYTFNPSIKDPNKDIKIIDTSVIDKSYPLGTKVVVTFSGNDGINGSTATASITSTISKGTAGYYGTDNKWHAGNYTQTISATAGGTLETTATWNSTSVTSTNEVTITNVGDNTLSVTSSGKTYSIGTFTTDTIYAATNTKKKIDTNSKTVAANGGGKVDKTDVALTANTKSCKVTGYKPIFWGQLTQTNKSKATWTAEEMTSGTYTSTVPEGSKKTTITTGTGTFFIAMPSDNAKVTQNKKMYVCASADKAVYGECTVADCGTVTYEHPNTTTSTIYKIFFITTAAGWGDATEMDIEWRQIY